MIDQIAGITGESAEADRPMPPKNKGKNSKIPQGVGETPTFPLPIDERGRVVRPGNGVENPLEVDDDGRIVSPAVAVRRQHGIIYGPTAIIRGVGPQPQRSAGASAARVRRDSSSPAPRIYMARRSTGGKRLCIRDSEGNAGPSRGPDVEVVPDRAPTPVPAPTQRAPAAAPQAPVVQSLVRVAARYRIYPQFCEDELWLTEARPRDVESLKPHHFAEEAEIDDAYPGWTDETVVSYSWAGLKFARDPHYPYYG
ncbi:hypothetical protein C8R43DRAFT_1120753 [Mycena crocata]|nr:hypothetical protein C8R43DRAFT_1120753 [Mycena crocata]